MARIKTQRAQTLLARVTGRRTPSPPAIAPALLELSRLGPASLREGPRPSEEESLRIATVIPSFRRGSGGHATIVRLMQGLRARGHEVSLWLEDCDGRHTRESPTLTNRSFAGFFAATDLPLHTDFDGWRGADVVLATGWQTVARALLLPDAHARAYLVQDHEPDFYPASAEALSAAHTYGLGLHCIAASEWLARLLRDRYGASASHFDLAADSDLYRPGSSARRGDLVAFYARAVTPRRAVPLGLAALAELAARRPHVEIALYGENRPLQTSFAHRDLGILDDPSLASLYSRATVGMVLSLTNPSLTGLEMMACGLPCIELASESMRATFGEDGPLQLCKPDPLTLCAAIERLLDDATTRKRASQAGKELMAGRSWSHATEQVELGLRLALRSSN